MDEFEEFNIVAMGDPSEALAVIPLAKSQRIGLSRPVCTARAGEPRRVEERGEFLMAYRSQRGQFERIKQGDAAGAQVANQQARAIATVVERDFDGREFVRQRDRM